MYIEILTAKLFENYPNYIMKFMLHKSWSLAGFTTSLVKVLAIFFQQNYIL